MWMKTDMRSVLVRHKNECPRDPCECEPSFRGEVWNGKLRRPEKSPVFANAEDAALWVSGERQTGTRYVRPEDDPSPATIQAALDVLARAGYRAEPPK